MMNVKVIRSDKIYKKIIEADEEEKNDIFRNEILKPFEFKYQCVGAPLKAEQEGGYDALSVCIMGGSYNPKYMNKNSKDEIDLISDDNFWNECKQAILDTLNGFTSRGIKLKFNDYLFTIILSDPSNPVTNTTGDYCGDGGIPPYIIGSIVPNEKSKNMLKVALAHETNHNVRWQYFKWDNTITLADMIISEGIAENQAAEMFGEDKIGKWVTKTDEETLNKKVKPIIKKNLYERDFNKISQYLYGDEIMSLRGMEKIGVPYCAGYAYGYYLIKHYMKKTGKSIYEVTLTSTKDILKETEDF